MILLGMLTVSLAAGENIEGTWKAKFKKDDVQLRMNVQEDSSKKGRWNEWSFCQYYTISDFSGVKSGKNVTFKLEREAGSLLFSGDITPQQGSGHFVFKPAENFRTFLKQKGFEEISDHKMLSMCLNNVKSQYVIALSKVGYSDISLSKLISFTIHDISISYIKEIQALGYGNVSASKMISFAIHDVSPDYIKSLQRFGYQDL